MYALVLTSKNKKLSGVKNLKETDIDQLSMMANCKFMNEDKLGDLWLPDDPPILKGAFNELAGSLFTKDYEGCQYWISYIRLWIKAQKKLKQTIEVAHGRQPPNCPVDNAGDPYWLLWAIVKENARQNLEEYVKETMRYI